MAIQITLVHNFLQAKTFCNQRVANLVIINGLGVSSYRIFGMMIFGEKLARFISITAIFFSQDLFCCHSSSVSYQVRVSSAPCFPVVQFDGSSELENRMMPGIDLVCLYSRLPGQQLRIPAGEDLSSTFTRRRRVPSCLVSTWKCSHQLSMMVVGISRVLPTWNCNFDENSVGVLEVTSSIKYDLPRQ